MSKQEINIEAYRHSLAHIMMQAMQRLYKATPGVGPAVTNGWYHDFESTTQITEVDLKKIEKEMVKIVKEKLEIKRTELSIDKGIELLKKKGYDLTLELAQDLKDAGETEISFYQQGEFINMCKGPHVSSTGDIKPGSFKLTKIAGAYWRGDEKNKMIQRIYGVAFATKDELQKHLALQAEAAKRDHRKLGKELDLFTFSPLVGSGLPLFLPKGTLLRDLIVEKIHDIQSEYGYQKVTIPHITKKDLYETSGHWDKFGDELFHVTGKTESEFVIKPMNCPHHTQIFAAKARSYRELPLRITEATMVYRDEQQGELLGLSRVRSITQDDGHVFCGVDQIEQEVNNIINIIEKFYQSLDMYGKDQFWVSVSIRDKDTPEKYLGEKKQWELAEKVLEKIAKKNKLPYKVVEGEASFYGPKLDFMFHDALSREWQLATAQLDFVMPQRFGLEYTNAKGKKETPVMIHRAIAGSLERFLAVIIEHFAGAFPLWLSPVQVKLVAVNDSHTEFCKKLASDFKKHQIRVEIDDTSETVGHKIRKAIKEKVPYMLVIGDKEMNSDKLSVRERGSDTTKELDKKEFIELF